MLGALAAFEVATLPANNKSEVTFSDPKGKTAERQGCQEFAKGLSLFDR
jgi:hypothetical protein